MVRLLPLCASLALVAACGFGAHGHARSHEAHGGGSSSAHHHASHSASARATLRAYLDATIAGRHGSAYKLLSARDQKQTSRAEYIEQWKSADRMRKQLDSLHRTAYDIASVSEHGDHARASVRMTTALGTERTGFALRREDGHWRIVYAESWRTSK